MLKMVRIECFGMNIIERADKLYLDSRSRLGGVLFPFLDAACRPFHFNLLLLCVEVEN